MAVLVLVSFPHPLLPQVHVGYHVDNTKFILMLGQHILLKNNSSAFVIIYRDQSLLRILRSGVKLRFMLCS